MNITAKILPAHYFLIIRLLGMDSSDQEATVATPSGRSKEDLNLAMTVSGLYQALTHSTNCPPVLPTWSTHRHEQGEIIDLCG